MLLPCVMLVVVLVLSLQLQRVLVAAACPPLPPAVSSLDFEKLSEGQWYDVRSLAVSGCVALRPRCVATAFGEDLTMSSWFMSGDAGRDGHLRGQLKHTSQNATFGGKFSLYYEVEGFTGTVDLNFVSVSYDDHVFIYGCEGSSEVAWLLSRSSYLSQSAQKVFADITEKFGGVSIPEIDQLCGKGKQVSKLMELALSGSGTSSGVASTGEPTPVAPRRKPENWDSMLKMLVAHQWHLLIALSLLFLLVSLAALAVHRLVLRTKEPCPDDEIPVFILAPNRTIKHGHINHV